MKLIIKYLKPYVLIVGLVIALTLVQVLTELKLPDYMSDIVTNGIQYAGINESTPSIINEEDMDKILLFSENKESILNNYELINKGQSGVIDNQEIEFTDNVYLLKEDAQDLGKDFKTSITYAYLSDINGVAVNQSNISEVKKSLENNYAEISNNIDSVVKLQLKNIYTNVGLNVTTIQNNYILSVGLKMLSVAAIGVFVQILSTYLATKTAAKISAKMRSDVFKKVESFSSAEFSKFSTPSLITRTGNDITKIQTLIQLMMRMMLMAPLMGITAIFKVAKYPDLSWILIVTIGIMILTMIILLISALPKFEVIQKLTDKINGIMREFLDGMLVIRAFNSEKYEEEKFEKINSDYRDIEIFVNRATGVISPIMTIIMNCLTIAVSWFAAEQIDMDVMTIGDLMAFCQYATHVVMSFMFVSAMFIMIPRSLVSVRRVNEILEVENTILDPDNPKQLPQDNGILKFDDVSFAYPGAEQAILEDVSFEVKPGETLAFIGSTGSGKSTIIKLIPRLFDVTKGKITYCDIDIRDVKQADLHERIGYATQKAILFSGDIKSNIEFGRAVSEDELNQAIQISQSSDIVKEKEEGVLAQISQGGTNVSGGQKQRLSIARTLAKKKNIYIFDDCFSALDYQTDKKLRNELNNLIAETHATVLIVAQRISTIKNADRILVIDKGKIVGEGKHTDLLKNCDVYKQIAYSQLSKEELA